MTPPPTPKLSVCIATYNRENFIGETLESIVSQLAPECEIVVSDNASTDGTGRILAEFARRFDRFRYVRQDENRGLDQNFNCAVELARGEYCWLMTDDDRMKPGAVTRVLAALRRDPSLVMVNAEWRDLSMSKVVQRGLLSFTSDRVYSGTEIDRLFVDLPVELLMYAGAYVVKQSIWLERDRAQYYGTLFGHIGTIFQSALPGEVLVVAEPLVSYRMGNAHSYDRLAEVWLSKWPSFVRLLPLSDIARKEMKRAEPWRNMEWLLLLRGLGIYSLADYRRWIRPRLGSTRQQVVHALVAICPSVLINAFLIPYYSNRTHNERFVYLLRKRLVHILSGRALARR